MGLTATLSAQALCDVLQILGMHDSTTQPTEALPRRTVYFRAPLSRPNLKYSVRMRPTNVLATQQMVTSYILQHHAEHSGIVYCLSRKDTHTMSEALTQLSHGQILTGVYHSDLTKWKSIVSIPCGGREKSRSSVRRSHSAWESTKATCVLLCMHAYLNLWKATIKRQDVPAAMDSQLTVFYCTDLAILAD